MIKLYNTLTRSIDEFKPLDDSLVRIYSCGPTVYGDVHIGNLAYFVFVDTLNRVLRAADYKVQHVMNITDIEDKIIKRSQSDYPDLEALEALSKLTEKYEQSFKHDSQAVGNDLSNLEFIKATDSIHLIQTLIKELSEAGIAYVADDGVYFSIEAYRKTGKTYGQLLDIKTDNTSQSRINNDEYDKSSVYDFVLWKTQKDGEPAWPFKLDSKDIPGRPGWHIECSAMSSSKLGQPFDIHTGGVDLIFPHHENEIAQSTAHKKDPLYAKFFVHSEHVTVNDLKMSKSIGNISSLNDILGHKFSPEAFRLFILQSNYRNQAEFNWELMTAAEARLRGLHNLSSLRFQTIEKAEHLDVDFKEEVEKLDAALFNNLNTPKALSLISELQNKLEGRLLDIKIKDDFLDYIDHLDEVFGLNLSKVEDISNKQRGLLRERQIARTARDWAKSDSIRDELHSQGIGINDGPKGQVWFRI